MSQGPRPLRSVAPEERVPLAQFCGHCGEPPGDSVTAPSRVCPHCGLGIVLSARRDLAPGPADAFLVVDETLSVCAVSRVAEELLDISEPQALHRHVMDFLVSGETTQVPDEDLLTALGAAAGGHLDYRRLVVELAGGDGRKFAVRLGSCGPPPAAVVVLAR